MFLPIKYNIYHSELRILPEIYIYIFAEMSVSF